MQPATAHPPSTSQPDPTGGGPASRTCAYTRCRVPLPPPQGTGRPRRYCPDRHHVTGDGRRVSCRQAGQAEELLRALHGTASLPDEGMARVGELLAAAVPASAELAELLTGVQTQLAEDVETSRRERDAAIATATRAGQERDGERERAQQATDDAGRARQEAVESIRVRDHAQAAATAAREAQLRAEARLADAQARADAAERDAQEERQRHADLTRERAVEQAAAAAALGELRDALDERRREHEAALTSLREEAERRVAEIRQATGERLDALSHGHAQEHARWHEATERLAGEAEAARHTLQQESIRRAAEVTELHRRLGELDARRAEAAARFDRAEDRLAGWRRALLAALGSPAESVAWRELVAGLLAGSADGEATPGDVRGSGEPASEAGPAGPADERPS